MTMRRTFLTLSVLLVLAARAPAPAMAADWDVGRLMQALAQQRGGSVSFVEKKYLAILDRPVESSGVLSYSPPDRLEKRTLWPKPESLVLNGNQLVAERGKQRVTLQLQQYPEISAVVGSIRETLSGDLGALERDYQSFSVVDPSRGCSRCFHPIHVLPPSCCASKYRAAEARYTRLKCYRQMAIVQS